MFSPLWPYSSQALTAIAGNENTSIHTLPLLFVLHAYSCRLAFESVWIFAQMTYDFTIMKYYLSLFMAIYLIELHSTLLFSNEFLCPSGL